MNRNVLTGGLLALVLGIGAGSHAQNAQTPSGARETKKMQATSEASALNAKELAFLQHAAQGGMFEVRVGQIAKQKAANLARATRGGGPPPVAEFGEQDYSRLERLGQRLQDDHSKANQRLKALAKAKGIELPANLDNKHESDLTELEKMPDRKFVRAFLDQQVQHHKRDIAQFEEMARSAKDADLRAFAEQTLPVLREHLAEAQALLGKVDVKAASARRSI